VIKLIALIAAVPAVCLISGLRADDQASQDAAGAATMFAQLDVNHDGQLASDEIPAEKKRLFERLLRLADTNGDGRLSRDEFIAGIERKPERSEADKTRPNSNSPANVGEGPNPERMFKRFDANGDGKLTLDEVPEPRQAMFQRLLRRAGKGGDGSLSEQEFVQGVQALRGQLAGKLGNENGAQRDPNAERVFRRLDTNGDGKLTRDEIPEERRAEFDRIFQRADKQGDKARVPPRGGLFAALDTDHDGKLSAAEISAAAETLKKLDTNGDGSITIDELLPPPE
jgi:Ca2+-binding EF-hand superfamily protein